MSNISWNASSLSNYFSKSLGSSYTNNSMSSLYNCLGDYNLIKSGKYTKLMRAYYNKKEDSSDKSDSSAKNEDSTSKTDSSAKTEDTTNKTTSSSKKNSSTDKTSSSKGTGSTGKNSSYVQNTGTIIDTIV